MGVSLYPDSSANSTFASTIAKELRAKLFVATNLLKKSLLHIVEIEV